MKRLKTYKLFNEGKDYNLEVIKDMLLDFTDKDIEVYVSDGTWILDKKSVEYVKISIGNPYGLPFSPEGCLLDVIDYLEDLGFVMMDESWYWNDSWQQYQGCPNCLSDDFEDNYNLRGTTHCNKCEYIGPPDKFLLDHWPVTRYDLAKDIKGRQVQQIELVFSDRKSLW